MRTNKEVVEAFVGKLASSTGNLMSSGDKLMSYQTCIAQWEDQKGISYLFVNTTYYSNTTSRYLNLLLERIKNVPRHICLIFHSVPIGTSDLMDYFNTLQIEDKVEEIYQMLKKVCNYIDKIESSEYQRLRDKKIF